MVQLKNLIRGWALAKSGTHSALHYTGKETRTR